MYERSQNDLIDGLLAISLLTKHLAQQLAGHHEKNRVEGEKHHVKAERVGRSTCRIVRA